MASRLEFKVGAFVLAGLVLLAVLMLQFSKGASLFRSKYKIHMEAQDVAGLREQAAVSMSGVQVGSVSAIRLADDGRSVTVDLTIDGRYKIYTNATFTLEQAGFLGDQYVAVQQRETGTVVFTDGGRAVAQKPFNIQEAARSAQSLIKRVDEMAQGLSSVITDMRRLLLNEATLTNISGTAQNLHTMSERGLASLDQVNWLVASNTPTIQHSTSNLAAFSDQLVQAGASINALVNTNSGDISQSIKNIQESTETLKSLMAGVQQGKGLAGALVKDDRVANDLAKISANLSITSSNLNRLGLWGVLWKKKRTTAEGDFEEMVEPSGRAPKASGK